MELVNVNEYAKIKKISRARVYTLIYTKRIPVVIGETGEYLIDKNFEYPKYKPWGSIRHSCDAIIIDTKNNPKTKENYA